MKFLKRFLFNFSLLVLYMLFFTLGIYLILLGLSYLEPDTVIMIFGLVGLIALAAMLSTDP